MTKDPAPHVALFVTCLADLFRPSVAFASIALLEQAGCTVEVPGQQTCCGQPGYNSGAVEASRPIARSVIETFEPYPYVVLPSGSCAGMLKKHYPALFADDPDWQQRAQGLAARTWEITSFLSEVLDFQPDNGALTETSVTYHDSCAGLRELGIKDQPRTLLARAGVDVTEMQSTDICCGFGGTFCAKMPGLSEKMVADKLKNATDTGAAMLLGGDLGCLLNIAGRASREAASLEVRHVVEVLAGRMDGAAIGEGR
ncbi:MAG: (Fe-S)-binding protein [Halieaceae bacterium]|jgi:L-lactate dehydrogenase complex protein LldE|nr:(Fe-S)-binding protein [Halieaceae bacterium]